MERNERVCRASIEKEIYYLSLDIEEFLENIAHWELYKYFSYKVESVPMNSYNITFYFLFFETKFNIGEWFSIDDVNLKFSIAVNMIKLYISGNFIKNHYIFMD